MTAPLRGCMMNDWAVDRIVCHSSSAARSAPSCERGVAVMDARAPSLLRVQRGLRLHVAGRRRTIAARLATVTTVAAITAIATVTAVAATVTPVLATRGTVAAVAA